jgi:hypothetical protein
MNGTRWQDTAVLVTGGASFIGSHLVDRLVAGGARVRVADNLCSDLYGAGWDTVPFGVGERRVPLPGTAIRASRYVRSRTPVLRRHPCENALRKVCRGPLDSKYEALSRYTFSLTYENMALDGWINEKLFDAMLAGTVPIDLGAPDINLTHASLTFTSYAPLLTPFDALLPRLSQALAKRFDEHHFAPLLFSTQVVFMARKGRA